MYDSPIKVFEQIPNIISEFNNQKEKLVCEAVAKVEVDVDKNELLKALQYDREQYSKGYSDGMSDGFQEALTSNGINIYVDKIKSDGAREFAEWLAECKKVSEPIKEYTINRWLEDFNKWQKEQHGNP